jgi:hypothetical protein
MTLVMLHVVFANVSHIKDLFVQRMVVGVLGNSVNGWKAVGAIVSQRIISLTEFFIKRMARVDERLLYDLNSDMHPFHQGGDGALALGGVEHETVEALVYVDMVCMCV